MERCSTGSLRLVTSSQASPSLIPELEELVDNAKKDAANSPNPDPLQVIAFFDLSGSTAAKIQRGTVAASREAIAFTALASSISDLCGGAVVKTLGDGALATFADPISACRAALNLRHATHELLDLEMTAGLTSGRPQRVALLNGQYDLLGDVVDRAARIQSLAAAGQVLIDGTLYQQVRGELVEQAGWGVDTNPRDAHAKGVGPLQLYELWLEGDWQPKRQLATPFSVIADGRPTLSEKLALVREAKSEIIEVGIGLTSFALYFTGQKPEEFRDPLRKLVRGGVNLKCFALDPTYQPGLDWLNEQGNADYLTEAAIARNRLQQESKYCRSEHYVGRFTYHQFRRVPEFWCLGVDIDDPVDGRMFFAPYMMGLARSTMPVVQVSRSSNAVLFDKYVLSIHELRANSDENLHRT